MVHTDSDKKAYSEIRDAATGERFAQMLEAWVGSDPELWMNDLGPGDRVVISCGQAAGSIESDELRLLASWSQAGWTRFDQDLLQIDRLTQEAGVELMVRPSAAGMLSDAICTNSWARRSEDLDCSLLLDPIGWLVPSMMRDVEDHLTRIIELCVGCPKVGAVLVRSVKVENGELVACSIDDGTIDPRILMDRFEPLLRVRHELIVLDQSDIGRLQAIKQD